MAGSCTRSCARWPAPSVLDPQVVLLSPGVFNSAYFEHVFLAREMGVPLVEGRDLVVENDRVFMRTVAGPGPGRRDLPPAQRRFPRPRGVQPREHAGRARADACLPQGHGGAGQCDRHRRRRRQGGLRLRAAADPLLSRPRTRSSTMSRPGSAASPTRWPTRSTIWPSWWSSRSANRAATASRSGRARPRARSRSPASGCWPIPANYISQPVIDLSVSPTLIDGAVEPRHVDLRPFAVTGKTTWVLPGGLSRVALKRGSLVVNSSQGGGSKDTWVLAERTGMTRLLVALGREPVLARPLHRARREPGPHPRRPGDLRPRQRRPAGLAPGAGHQRRRRGVLQAAHRGRQRPACCASTSPSATNPTSIFSDVHAARENARALRPLISTEMWTQLNMLYNRLLALKPSGRGRGEALGPVRLDQARLRRAYRHHRRHVLPRRGLVLLPAGRRDRVRRPDHPPARRQVPQLHGAGRPATPARPPTASTGWRCCARPPATRRSAAATRAAWRPSRWRPSCSSDPCFPRSVACCLGIIDEQLTALRRQYNLRAAGAAP